MQSLLTKQKELEEEITTADVKLLLKEIQDDLGRDDHGIELVAVAKGYQLRTKYEISLYFKNEKVSAPARFSPSSLETLAIIAYQQPVTRNKIEDIRGVDSGGVIKTLLDKGIIRVVGRSDEPGKPLIYGTSLKFLEVFSLNQLKDLPSLADYDSLRLSQDHQQTDNATDEPRHGMMLDDLVEDNYEVLSEEEQAILDDLNASIKDLRKVEKNVLVSTGIKVDNPEPEQQDTLLNQTSEVDGLAQQEDSLQGPSPEV
ncbi:MAG: SMC-Scp complex subunit ScpB [Deltaproteobacteria bacterium]|nr:SMC-Scp complex subunit ScpB [Deltaproteobacteria bacterium]